MLQTPFWSLKEDQRFFETTRLDVSYEVQVGLQEFAFSAINAAGYVLGTSFSYNDGTERAIYLKNEHEAAWFEAEVDFPRTKLKIVRAYFFGNSIDESSPEDFIWGDKTNDLDSRLKRFDNGLLVAEFDGHAIRLLSMPG